VQWLDRIDRLESRGAWCLNRRTGGWVEEECAVAIDRIVRLENLRPRAPRVRRRGAWCLKRMTGGGVEEECAVARKAGP